MCPIKLRTSAFFNNFSGLMLSMVGSFPDGVSQLYALSTVLYGLACDILMALALG
jgi:hypothetical protein